MIATKGLTRQNKRYAKLRWGNLLGRIALRALGNLTEQFQFSVANVTSFSRQWLVRYHSGLTSMARRSRCAESSSTGSVLLRAVGTALGIRSHRL